MLLGFKIPPVRRMPCLLKILAKLFIKIFWSTLWGCLWSTDRGALLLFPFCTQRSEVQREREGHSLESQSYWVTETLNLTFDIIGCSFHCTDIIIFNKEILQIIYFHPQCRFPVHSITNGPAQLGPLQKGGIFLNNLININMTKVMVSDLKMLWQLCEQKNTRNIIKTHIHTNEVNIHTANTSFGAPLGPINQRDLVVFLWHFMHKHVSGAMSPSDAQSTFLRLPLPQIPPFFGGSLHLHLVHWAHSTLKCPKGLARSPGLSPACCPLLSAHVNNSGWERGGKH